MQNDSLHQSVVPTKQAPVLVLVHHLILFSSPPHPLAIYLGCLHILPSMSWLPFHLFCHQTSLIYMAVLGLLNSSDNVGTSVWEVQNMHQSMFFQRGCLSWSSERRHWSFLNIVMTIFLHCQWPLGALRWWSSVTHQISGAHMKVV
jgi:hypothetical protein